MSTARFLLWSPLDNTIQVTGDALPAITVPAAARVAAMADRWCREPPLAACIIAVIGAMGRHDGSLDWGVWLRATRPMSGYDVRALTAFALSAPDPIDRRLSGALLDIIRCSGSSAWIGFNPAWPERVRTWIANTIGVRCDDIRTLRADATALVAKCNALGGTVFFTARPLPFPDPELCDVLHDHSPLSFPPTIASDAARGWWLTADVGGLDGATYVQQGDRVGRLARMLEAVASVQVSTRGSSALPRLCYPITRDAVIAGVERLFAVLQTDAIVPDDDRASILVDAANLWDTAGADCTPAGWVHSDPAPDNIRVDDAGRTVFLDLEDPWYGPIPLMGALAIHSLGRRSGWSNDQVRAFSADAWRKYTGACELTKPSSFGSWLRLAQLVRLIRRVDRSATESPLLLEEEVPRRSLAIRTELGRLCGRSTHGYRSPAFVVPCRTRIGSKQHQIWASVAASDRTLEDTFVRS